MFIIKKIDEGKAFYWTGSYWYHGINHLKWVQRFDTWWHAAVAMSCRATWSDNVRIVRLKPRPKCKECGRTLKAST